MLYQDRLGTKVRKRPAKTPGVSVSRAHSAAKPERCDRGKETRLFALPFYGQNDHFTKTGSGQT